MNVHPPPAFRSKLCAEGRQCDEDKDIGDYQEPILIWIFSFISATEDGQIFRISNITN